MATGVTSYSQTAATNASSDSAQNWAEGMAPSAVNDSARGGMASVAKYRDDTAGTLTTAGTSTAYTVTSNQGFASLAAMSGAELAVKFNATNGAAPTLAVDGLAAKAINVSVATAVGTGVILANSIWNVTYDNANSIFILRGVAAQVQDATVATASIANAAVTYAKVQNVSATARLLGRTTAGAGVIEEISLASGLSFVAGVLTPGISAVLVPNYLSGLTLSTAGSSATMSIAAGVANDSTNTVLMSLAAIGKTTSSWAVGTGNGGLDTGAIATSTWYHFYVIERVDTGVVDVVYSLSASSPTLPTNYTVYRRIGSGKTNGSSQWTQFIQFGDYFYWTTGVNDSASLPTTTDTLYTLASVPTGVRVIPFLQIGSGSTSNTQNVRVRSPDLNSTETSISVSSGLSTFGIAANGTTVTRMAWSNMPLITNTSAQVSIIGDAGNTEATFTVRTEGWLDFRGK